MTTETCNHQHCGGEVLRGYARYKYVEGKGMVAFHPACAFAAPDYDVSKGTGAPFTTIVMR